MEDWKKRYDKFEKRFWLKMKGRVYYDNYETVTIKEGWNIEVKRFIEQELSKAKKEIVFTDEELEVIEYNLRGIQDVLGGIEDEILESILGKIDSLSKLKDNK